MFKKIFEQKNVIVPLNNFVMNSESQPYGGILAWTGFVFIYPATADEGAKVQTLNLKPSLSQI